MQGVMSPSKKNTDSPDVSINTDEVSPEASPAGKGSERNPLEIYLKEIRKIPLLSQKDEKKWARCFTERKNRKIALLQQAVDIVRSIQSYKPLNGLLLFNKDSLYEYIHLQEALKYHNKRIRVEQQLSHPSPQRDRRKLAKEKLKLDQEYTEILSKIDIKPLPEWQCFMSQSEGSAGYPAAIKSKLKSLYDIWKKLEKIEPDIKEARQHLIQSNLRLVVSICSHYRNRAVSFRDLIQEGNLGLIKAVEKFDYTKGFRLNTYASWWIREGINRAIEEKSRVIRIPVYVNEKFYQIKKISKKAFQNEGKESSVAELAAKLKTSPQEIARVLIAFKEPVSLETSLVDNIDPLETFLSDDSPTPLENICEDIIKDKAAEIIGTLPAREAAILRMRFGLGEQGEQTLEEVGAKFKVSRERVRQLENKALRKLRKNKELRNLLTLLSQG
jgi:RNA polymerase sigma factor (sigma-70 family)